MITHWSCAAECSYQCMWSITTQRQAEGAVVRQYHGKWPFRRYFGFQEPAGALFSALNAAAHASGLRSCWTLTGTARGGWVWRATALLQINAWIWATIFHCRDVFWTQCADYFSATLLIGGSALVATWHLLDECRGALPRRWMAALSLLAAMLYCAHVRRMLRFFDYGEHMRLNLVVGGVHLALWATWWRLTRSERPHAWRAPAILATVPALLVLELRDTSPVWDALDGHAMWHAGTVGPAIAFWRAFVTVELRWRVQRERAHRA